MLTAHRTMSFRNVQLFKQKTLMISLIFKYPQNIFIIYNNTTQQREKKTICFVRALVEFYGEKFNGKYNSKHVKCICSFLMLYLFFG